MVMDVHGLMLYKHTHEKTTVLNATTPYTPKMEALQHITRGQLLKFHGVKIHVTS
jgi:hypothetical protein